MWIEYFSELYNHPDQGDPEIIFGTSPGHEDDFPIQLFQLYPTISLISHPSKVMLKILLKKLKQ